MKAKYNLKRENNYKKYLDINVENSYNVNKKMGDERLGLIRFYNDDLINRVIKKKTDTVFKYILELMIQVEEDDSDPSEGLMICLNELDKLQKEMVNKYRRFLDKKKREFLEKKIMVLESEIKMKLFNIQIIREPMVMNNAGYGDAYEEEEVKESSRRR